MVPGKPLAAQEIWEVCVDALTQEIIGVDMSTMSRTGDRDQIHISYYVTFPVFLGVTVLSRGSQEAKRLLSSLWAQVYK